MKKAILRTLVYADIFDYPLKKEEIQKWLIAGGNLKSQISKLVQEENGFYFLKGRENLVELRRERERQSREKIKIAEKVAGILRKIFWIKMIGITGALAMKNSDKEDDIDLLIVTKRNRLWITRLLTVFLVELVARRRRPGDRNVRDKICLNMFLGEEHLEVPKKEQDLFSAHEVCQLKVIWEKDGIYQKFLKENQWVRQFLPNWKP
ncbi:hypothetical protein COU95_03000 [Candidatus Shapirobacteria bacterium CG10_big_fil_rev_8_21_14_0_10_40_9]|uniref:Polymerase nucleotidyl transferase domain-containing protein n=1 Tax=Candidatus Shapirobacteria bacterium CG10_big_fil_rev_8_21_14_0_10_40_9 TaxID=1974888 RepID=A0A2M8L308_9BACT|nr:MAG: hypothetical protein COU95_03000 [Candidatus Shapirobacteria bacterium CG10_big_fil_rev_8_21_14_0_10_40_9]